MDRRLFLRMSCASGICSAIPRVAFANAATDSRMVFVILRGGLDGLHALAPYADPAYQRLRPRLALDKPGSEKGVLDLDGYFGLHPALAPMHALYQQGDLLLIPAATTRYRDRSHFDGQNLLENGSGIPFGARDGWLNRAIASLGSDRRLGLSFGPTLPLVMQGQAKIATWADSPLPKPDEDFMFRLALMYQEDPTFAETLEEANGSFSAMLAPEGRVKRGEEFERAAKTAAQLLARSDGPRIAVMDSRGWDTHFGQRWRLATLLEELAAGVMELKTGLGPVWDQTTIIVVSEFGRTAAENGSQGTDHGVGGLAMLLGGAVKGGRIGGDWPGLTGAALYEGRDVLPTTDYESLFKAALIERLGLAPGIVEDHVFPSSRAIRPAEGLFHSV
ncbi:MAG: DUF1501 domain-containing protein [Pseudomonadota bacterium]